MPKPSIPADEASRSINLEYYLTPSPGRADYWRKMAAPRFRVATFLELLRGIRPRTVVDLGCGGGEMLLEIHRAFPDAALCGVDLAPHQVEANRRKAPAIDWRVADLDQEQPFPADLAGRFDVVVAAEIIEHVAHPEIFSRNARQLARRGTGHLVLSTQSGPVLETERRVGHRQHFSAEAMRALLRHSGWEPVRVWNAGFPFHDLSKRLANIDPDRTMKRFSGMPYTHVQNAVCCVLRALFRLNSRRRGAQLFAVARNAAG